MEANREEDQKMKRRFSKNTTLTLALTFGLALTAALPLGTQAADINTWNLDNVSIEAPPPGGYVPEETYTSTVYTDITKTVTNGGVIWVESDVQAPGLSVVNDDDVDGSNCIMSAGFNPTDWTIKQCSDPFQTSKRFKLTATAPDTSVDLVFSVNDSVDVNTYRILQKYINKLTNTRIGSFTVRLGFGTGDAFTASVPGDGLGFSTSAGAVYDPSVPTLSDPANDLELAAVFPFGLFGDAETNTHHTIDGYFDPTDRARFSVSAVEDTITNVGQPSANYYDLFNNWLAKDQVPYGYFYDDDGDPLTDAILIANWNGAAWETYTSASPQLPGTPDAPAGTPVPVDQADLDVFAANPDTGDGVTPFYFVDFIDDLSNLNLNYYVTVAADIGQWPTYSGGAASFTMRVTNTAAADAPLPWYDSLPPELESPAANYDVALTALNAPKRIDAGEIEEVTAFLVNDGPDAASGVVTIEGVDEFGNVVGQFSESFADLAPAKRTTKFEYNWTAPNYATTVTWTATVTADGDNNPDNNTQTAVTIVK